MATFFRNERRRLLLATSTLGAAAVTLTLAVDLARGYPIVSLIGACLFALLLRTLWVRAGKPSGVAEAERLAETAIG
jgi:hypothetical protein